MIPEEKQAVVRRALRGTFGVEEWDTVQLLTAGLSSAKVYRIHVAHKDYVLRVIMRTDAMSDPAWQFSCVKTAVELGIAPRVLYESVEDRVMISDFIDPHTFPTDMDMRMARTLRALHAAPPFSKVVPYLKIMDGAVQRFCALNLLPAAEMEKFSNGYQQAVTAYPCGAADLVSSHNDLKPDNVLFDGDRVWLVDWEAAFLNDRYCDLAVVANFYLPDGRDAEEAFLHAYWGEPAGERRLAQFFLMRQIMSCIYAAYFLHLASSAGRVETSMPLPGFRELHRKLVAGEVYLLDPRRQAKYGLLHFRQALLHMGTTRFADALSAVKERG